MSLWCGKVSEVVVDVSVSVSESRRESPVLWGR